MKFPIAPSCTSLSWMWFKLERGKVAPSELCRLLILLSLPSLKQMKNPRKMKQVVHKLLVVDGEVASLVWFWKYL